MDNNSQSINALVPLRPSIAGSAATVVCKRSRYPVLAKLKKKSVFAASPSFMFGTPLAILCTILLNRSARVRVCAGFPIVVLKVAGASPADSPFTFSTVELATKMANTLAK